MTTEERIKSFYDMWKSYAPEDYDYLVVDNNPFMGYLTAEKFFTAPASTKYHGAYEGGLFDHSTATFKRLDWLTKNNNLKWEREISPFIIGMFHDLCKCDQYKMTPESFEKTVVGGVEITIPCANPKYEFNTNTLLKGHGSKSVMILSRFINLTEEEMLCIRYHMGPYEKEEWPEFDMAIRKYPNVLWTHMSDMLASKVDDT